MIYIEESKDKFGGLDYDILIDGKGMPVGFLTLEAILELGLTEEDFKEGQRIQLAVKKGDDDRLDMEGRSL